MNLKDQITYYVEFVFPQLAIQHNWPIRFDHCFRRVIYDNCLGGKWSDIISSPAIKHLSIQQLQLCVDICELIIDDPPLLIRLNNQSLAWRKGS